MPRVFSFKYWNLPADYSWGLGSLHTLILNRWLQEIINRRVHHMIGKCWHDVDMLYSHNHFLVTQSQSSKELCPHSLLKLWQSGMSEWLVSQPILSNDRGFWYFWQKMFSWLVEVDKKKRETLTNIIRCIQMAPLSLQKGRLSSPHQTWVWQVTQ